MKVSILDLKAAMEGQKLASFMEPLGWKLQACKS